MSIGNIDHRRWKKETSVRGHLRSSDLRALDKAIERYCNPGGGTPANLALVKTRFRQWKGSSVGRNTSSRNASGIVEELEGYLNGTTPMSNAYLKSQEDGRLGLLYVYGGLSVDTKLFNLVIESAWSLGSAGFSYEGTQKDIVGAIGGDALSLDQKKAIAKLPSQVLGNSLVQKGRDMVVDKATEAYDARQNRGNAPTPPPRPAPGNVPGGPLKIGNPATGGAFRVESGIISSREFEQAAMEPPSAAAQFGRKIIQAIKDKLQFFAQKVWSALRAQYDQFQESPYDFFKEWGHRVATLINFIVCKILGEAGKTVAPVVGGAITIGRGIADTIGACAKKYETWVMGKNVDIAPGHPQAVTDGIKVIQTAGIGKGLYDTLKGATQLGLDVGAAASGAIFGLVTSCCEVLAKFIHRLWDSSRLESFAKKCKQMYDAGKTGQEGALPRAGEFGKFLRGYIMTCPTIACVAMVSNYAGDAMQWLDMNSTFNQGADVPADQWKAGNAEFDAAAKNFQQGTELLTHMKKLAREYLLQSGFSFKHTDDSLAYLLSGDNLKKPGIGMLAATGGAI